MVYQKSKDGHSPNVIRFFKIMFGKDFGKFLIVWFADRTICRSYCMQT
ncbi:hypothetical protein OROGR_031168 [Orobanche gracilis]